MCYSGSRYDPTDRNAVWATLEAVEEALKGADLAVSCATAQNILATHRARALAYLEMNKEEK